VGQAVLSGQRLGTLELGASHCFPRTCLHWGWRRGDTYLDPLLLVGGGPIRLLPLWVPDPVPRASRWRPLPSPYSGLYARLLAGWEGRVREPHSLPLLVRSTPRAP
jgi:hypothetical protein